VQELSCLFFAVEIYDDEEDDPGCQGDEIVHVVDDFPVVSVTQALEDKSDVSLVLAATPLHST